MSMDEYGGHFVVISPEELRQLRESAERAKLLAAEFAAFQERARRDREDLARYAVAEVLQQLMPVLDAFDVSLSTLKDPAVADGVRMVQQELLKSLAKHGFEPIAAQGRPFDPRLHLACGIVETDAHPEGTVAEELKKGYRLRDRVLRPAMVKIAKPKPVQ